MTDNPPPSQPPTWSSEARTWASLLLFAHLFAVVVAVTSFTRPSVLQQQLHGLFDPYLRMLHLAPARITYPFARFHLTHGAADDVDYSCLIDVQKPGGNLAVTLPDQELWPAIRYRRYQSLVNAAGSLAQPDANEDLAGVLPKAIAGSILKREDARRSVLRLQAQFLPELRNDRPAREETLYEAQVFVSGNSVELLKKAATLEIAPIENGRQPLRGGASGGAKKP
jgi:hypothetical protein